MKTTLCTICLSLALVAPTPTLSYSYNRHPIITSDDNNNDNNQQQQQQQPIPALPSLPSTTTKTPSNVVVENVAGQQKQTVDKYLSGLLQTLGTYGAPEVVQETAEEAAENIQEAVENLNETAEEIAEEVQETFDHIQEIANERGEYIEEAVENVRETAEEQVERVEETLENIQEVAEEIQESMTNATEAAEEQAEEAQETLEEAREYAQETAEEHVEQVEELLESVQDTAEEQQEQAQETLGSISEYVQEATEQQVEQAQETLEQVKEYAQEAFEQLLDAIKGKANTTGDTDDSEDNDGGVVVTAAPAITITTTDSSQEVEDDENDAATSAPVTATTDDSSSEVDNDGGIIATYAPVATTTPDASNEVADDNDNDGYAVSTPAITDSDDDSGSQEEDEGMTTVASVMTTEDDDSSEVTTATPIVVFTTDDDVSQEVDGNDSSEVTTPIVVIATTDDDVSQEIDGNDDDNNDEVSTDAPTTDADNDDSAEHVITTTAATYDRTLIPEDSSEEADSADSDDVTSDDSDDVDSDEVITTAAPAAVTTVSSMEDSAEEDGDVSTSTTTTTYVPVSTTVVPNLCDGCEFQHGVGYNPHPSDCTLFVQCRMGSRGYPVVAGVKSCSHGLYWNQQKLTCDFRRNVNCVDDICRGQKKTKRSGASCRGYWDCSSGSVRAKCCAKGFAYNPVTARCHYQPDCHDDCLATSTQVSLECGAGMRGVADDRTVYEVKTGSTWTRMPCPPTLAFSTNPCGCNVPRSQVQQLAEPVCAPELYLPFNSDARDFSGHNVHVKNEGVLVKDGKAFFDGHSRLTVNRFSSAWWGATVYVHLRFKSLAGGSGLRQALVSNGDCQVRPSLAVCAGPTGVDFYAETQNSALPANFTVPYGYSQGSGWQDVLYKLDGNQLYGYVNTYTSQASAKGNLASRQRGLVIGSGGGCEDFEGFIDELTVYLCRPDFK